MAWFSGPQGRGDTPLSSMSFWTWPAGTAQAQIGTSISVGTDQVQVLYPSTTKLGDQQAGSSKGVVRRGFLCQHMFYVPMVLFSLFVAFQKRLYLG
eukprot:scaffold3158_cov389-Prasinococcus_capsulatus_cf.AAC.3